MSSAVWLSRVSALFSGVFFFALGTAALAFKSDLALAQAADSLMDVFAAFVLAWVVTVARKPSDEGHPLGHRSAEPLGALGLAFVAGVLAVEVLSSAVKSLLGDAEVNPSKILLSAFLLKTGFKIGVFVFTRGKKGPALSALHVDARNDVLVGLVAVAGYFSVVRGYHLVDAWLSIPVAIWIGWSGFELARENIHLLMGASAPAERRGELLRLAEGVAGVRGAHDLRATHLGVELSVHVHVTVNERLTVREGHDLGELVRRRLLVEKDVSHCSVHVDPG